MIKKSRTLSKNYVTEVAVTTVGFAPGTNQTYVCIVEELRERLCVLQVVLSLGRRWCQFFLGNAAPQDNPRAGEKHEHEPVHGGLMTRIGS